MHDQIFEAKRQAIVDAASTLFIEQGFDKTTMQKVADTAGVSKRTLYKHFSNKEALLGGVVLLLIDKNHKMAGQDFNPDQPLDVQLDYILRGKIAILQDPHYRALTRVLTPLLMIETDKYRPLMMPLVTENGPLMIWLNQVKAHGLLRQPNTLMLGKLIQGMLERVVFWSQITAMEDELNKKEIDELVDTIIAMFMTQVIEK